MARSEDEQHEPVSPQPTRMKTRSKNATTHPGAILRDVHGVRRTKEEVADAKMLKNLQIEAKLKKKNADEARKASGEAHITYLEGIEAVVAANDKTTLPRHRDRANIPDTGAASKGKKRASTNTNRLPTISWPEVHHQSQGGSRKVEHSQEVIDTDNEAPRAPPPKRTKIQKRYGNTPLRRTASICIPSKPKWSNHATFGEDDGVESEANGSPGSEIKEDDEVAMGEDLEMGEDDGAMGEDDGAMGEDDGAMGEDDGADDGAEMGEGELTPRPRKPSGRQVGYDGDDDDNEPFETPLTLRRKNREDKWHYMKHAQGHGLEQEETVKRKRDQMEEDGKKGTKGNMFGIKGQSIINKPNASASSSSALFSESHRHGPSANMKKIDLAARFNPPRSSRGGQDSQPPKSGSTHLNVAFPSRTTSSNGVVASKPSSKTMVAGPARASRTAASTAIAAAKPSSKKVPTSHGGRAHPSHTTAPNSNRASRAKPSSTVDSLRQGQQSAHPPSEQDDSTPEPNALGGMSEEDDSREKELAMSSPVKGHELRSTTKSMVKEAEHPETKPRKRATVQDLPNGANENAAWTRLVVPNFINLILAGEQPWIITDDVIVAELQRVWDHVYGERVEFTIEKGTVPFDLITQKLCDYRNRLAHKAICVVITYFHSKFDIEQDSSIEDLNDELAEFARELLETDPGQSFIFKGMENSQKPKRTGGFKHTLIIETLAAHFSILTQGSPLRGLKIAKPRLGLALTAAAVERALALLANHMIEDRLDSKGKNKKPAVRKVLNPNSGKASRSPLEFSAAGWNQITVEYFNAVKKLSDARLTEIYDEAKALATKSRPGLAAMIANDGPSKLDRSNLQSDEESDEDLV